MKRKPIPKKIREQVYNKYNGHCAYCGCELIYKDMQVDHMISVCYNHFRKELDDINTIDNLMPSCRQCNYDKKEYTEQEELVNDMMMLIASFSDKVYSLRTKENRKKRKENKKMNNDLLKLIQDTKDAMINGFSKISDNPTNENVLCGVEISFDKILKIVRFYDDVINGKWIKFSDACPEDFNLDWVLVQFVEKSGFVGLPYIAEFDKTKNIWRLQGQENDNTIETYYINNDCIPSSWKIIENSPEFRKSERKYLR